MKVVKIAYMLFIVIWSILMVGIAIWAPLHVEPRSQGIVYALGALCLMFLAWDAAHQRLEKWNWKLDD